MIYKNKDRYSQSGVKRLVQAVILQTIKDYLFGLRTANRYHPFGQDLKETANGYHLTNWWEKYGADCHHWNSKYPKNRHLKNKEKIIDGIDAEKFIFHYDAFRFYCLGTNLNDKVILNQLKGLKNIEEVEKMLHKSRLANRKYNYDTKAGRTRWETGTELPKSLLSM